MRRVLAEKCLSAASIAYFGGAGQLLGGVA
jgi:hypothetical protein